MEQPVYQEEATVKIHQFLKAWIFANFLQGDQLGQVTKLGRDWTCEIVNAKSPVFSMPQPINFSEDQNTHACFT